MAATSSPMGLAVSRVNTPLTTVPKKLNAPVALPSSHTTLPRLKTSEPKAIIMGESSTNTPSMTAPVGPILSLSHLKAVPLF